MHKSTSLLVRTLACCKRKAPCFANIQIFPTTISSKNISKISEDDTSIGLFPSLRRSRSLHKCSNSVLHLLVSSVSIASTSNSILSRKSTFHHVPLSSTSKSASTATSGATFSYKPTSSSPELHKLSESSSGIGRRRGKLLSFGLRPSLMGDDWPFRLSDTTLAGDCNCSYLNILFIIYGKELQEGRQIVHVAMHYTHSYTCLLQILIFTCFFRRKKKHSR